MSIVRQARACSGRRGGPGMGAFGFGDTTVTITPTMQLVAQLNRFGPSAPAAYQFLTAPLASGNVITLDVASVAMLIYQRRAMDSYARFADDASRRLIANANAGMSNPVAWVTSNLADVLTVVKSYGDSVGLPPAAGSSVLDSFTVAGPLGVPVYAWTAGGALVLYMLLRGRARKGR